MALMQKQALASRGAVASRRSAVVVKASKYDEELVSTAVRAYSSTHETCAASAARTIALIGAATCAHNRPAPWLSDGIE